MMGLETEPYIVTKVAQEVDKSSKGGNNSRSASRYDMKQELGFKLTYISNEFQKQFLPRNSVKVEDLVFR